MCYFPFSSCIRRSFSFCSMVRVGSFGLSPSTPEGIVLAVGESESASGVWTGPAVMALLGIGLVAAPVGTWCTMQATTELPLVVASVGFLAAPAIGVVLAALWLHEPLTLDVVAGSVLILGGAAVAIVPGRR